MDVLLSASLGDRAKPGVEWARRIGHGRNPERRKESPTGESTALAFSSLGVDTVRLRHALEQFGAGAQELAPLLAAYYARLKLEGFSPPEALQLVRDMQAHIVSLAKEERP